MFRPGACSYENNNIILYLHASYRVGIMLPGEHCETLVLFVVYFSVCEKFQTTRAKVAPVTFIYGSHFTATEATYKVSLMMVNFVEFTRTFTRIRRKPVPL